MPVEPAPILVMGLASPTLVAGLFFSADALKFVAILGLLACIGGVFTLIISILHRLPKKEIFLRVFDLFTDAVPPALPASMSVGLSVAVSRSVFFCRALHVRCLEVS